MYHGGLLRLVHFDPAIVSVYHGFLRRSLICRASPALMFSNYRHPRFRYFGSVVPVYVVWVKFYVNCLFRFPCVPAKTEELAIVGEIESKGGIFVPHKVLRKVKPLIENFTIYEREEGEEGNESNPVSVLNESVQKSKKTISFDELGVNSKTGLFSCSVTIANQLVAVGEGVGKKQAKRTAAENALSMLRPRQPVIRLGSLSRQHESAPCVSKTKLVSKAYEKAASISEDNIGNKMLRKMGWTGSGGIGKEGQGRAEPVIALGTDGKFGLGCNPTHGSQVKKQTIRDVLMSFISGKDREIKFSSELSKEDRAVIHKISQQYGLKHKSYGKGDDRYLVVGKD